MKKVLLLTLVLFGSALLSGCSMALFSKTHERNLRQYNMITFVDQEYRDHRYLFAIYDGEAGRNNSSDSFSLIQLYSTTVDPED